MDIRELLLNPHTSPNARSLDASVLAGLQKELDMYVEDEKKYRPGYVPGPEDFHIMRDSDGSFHVIDD